MSFPDFAGLSGLGPLEREHLARIEQALSDLLLSSTLEARMQNLDPGKTNGAVVSLLFAMAARQAFLSSRDIGEEFRIDSCVRTAEEAALWVRDRNERVFGLS